MLRIFAFIIFFTAICGAVTAQFAPQKQLFAEPGESALDIDLNKHLNSEMIGIDEFISNTNSENFSSYEHLAIYLSEQFNDPERLSRSIYTWIALNISYDQSSVSKANRDNQSARQVWKNRSAVCEGYANLFNEMCSVAGIESRIINGYVKSFAGNDLSYPNHSWNSVKINGKWRLLDVTWASVNSEGHVRSNPDLDKNYMFHKLDHFFHVNPNRMILTHLPEDPFWQLHDNYVNLEIFKKGEEAIKSTLKNSTSGKKDFEQLIADYENLDSLDKSISYLERMERNSKNRSREYGLGIAYYYKAQEILKNARTSNSYKAAQEAKFFYEKSLSQLAVLQEEDYGYKFSKELAKNVAFRIEALK